MISETTAEVQQTGFEINQELEIQDKMLDQLDSKIDNNLNNIQKAKNKLDDYLKNTSFCKFYLVILILVVSLF